MSVCLTLFLFSVWLELWSLERFWKINYYHSVRIHDNNLDGKGLTIIVTESWNFHGSVVEDHIQLGYNFAKIGDRVQAFQRTYYFTM
jgi:hypothetical protein